MATPASIRLPWRALSRSFVTGASSTQTAAQTQVFRAQCIAAGGPAARVLGRRNISDSAQSSSASPSSSEATPQSQSQPQSESTSPALDPRLPRAVQAVYLRPLRRTPTYNVPVCDLQLRSYSVRNLEFFCDFALRAAYYLNLAASGPVPLPRIVERWTVPRGSFRSKKSQENFERKTLRRLIQIKDGHPETVQVWLAFLSKHAYYGIGMKANVWEWSSLGVGKNMDIQMEKLKGELDATWENFAFKKGSETEEKALEILNREDFRAASGATGPMIKPPPKAQ